MVDLLVGTLLEALAAGPQSLEDLADAVMATSDMNAHEASSFIAEALPQLTDLNLIEALPPDADR